MAKKTSRQAIEKRIKRSLQCLQEGDAEDAIFNIAPIIDVVAKERHKDKKMVGDRIKAFIFDEQYLLYYISTQGKIRLPDGVKIKLVNWETDEPVGGVGGELADFIYHNIRCAQTHDAEIDYDLIDFGRNFGIGRLKFEGDGGELVPGVFIISNATVLALILSVICAPENRGIRLGGDMTLYNKVSFELAKLVGNKKYLMDKLDDLFKENS
ncbi:hypothetical protein [Methylotuvimicrobium sp.]|uniref:hypothetical protein n=1 Tax=Methylotuvimicrobium sp. TaxID=2822413 RepID=UPI003D65E3D1